MELLKLLDRRAMTKKKIFSILLFAAVLLAFGATALFTVDETQVGVVTRFGRALEEIRQPGLNLKMPWPIDQAILLDQRRLYLRNEPQEMLTDDEKNVIVEGYLLWHIDDPILFVETVKTRVDAETRLRDLFTARMGAKVGNLPFDGFVNVGLDRLNFHEIYDEVGRQINEITEANFGIRVHRIQITGFTLPSANRASVIARMNAERERIAARYRSEGVEQALKIEAKAAAEHERILSAAHAEATLILGKGEATALEILREAFEKDPEFYRFLRSLESYEPIVGKETTLFLESDSKLFKTLYGESRTEESR